MVLSFSSLPEIKDAHMSRISPYRATDGSIDPRLYLKNVRPSVKMTKKYQEELLISELETLRKELITIEKNYQNGSFLYEKMQKRFYTRFLLKIPGIRFLLAVVIKLNDILNQERDSAFIRQNETVQSLIELLKNR
jgi:hypothetical protein